MFNRSRPWRARGPSLGAHAGQRRRGRLAVTQPGVPSHLMPSASDDESFGSGYAVAADDLSIDLASLTESLYREQVVARIDEAGLQAMVWRGQAQSPATMSSGEPQDGKAIVNSPLDLFVTPRRDLMVISRPRRSA